MSRGSAGWRAVTEETRSGSGAPQLCAVAPQPKAFAGPMRPGPRGDIVRAGVVDAVSDDGNNLVQRE
eukprot:8837671-Alexandrium_andersonii.AAC.1